MKNRNLKFVLASTIAATSAAAIVYATPKIIKTVAVENNADKFILNVENIDADTVKVSLDNIEDIPKALQFSIKLDGVVLKEENGNPVIKDLINKNNSDKIITDYSYNKDTNTIDVLITSQDSIAKNGNEVEVFEIDIEKAPNNESRKYNITPEKENSKYKYVSDTNKEYEMGVEVANNDLSINTAPTVEKINENYIEVNVGDTVELTKDLLSNYIKAEDKDNDEVIFEVKNVDDTVIDKFTSTTAGIYDLYVTAKDSFGGESEVLNLQIKVNQIDQNPTVTKDGQELTDVTINAGEIFNLMDGISAVDALGNALNVTVNADKELNLDPDVDTEYTITYTAIDSLNRKTEKTITLTVKANKAPIINGVKDYTLTVGDEFDPRTGVEVIDEDEDIELVIESNVNTKIAGVYKVLYSATDSGNKTTRIQSIVVVNPKMESINGIPVINASDVVIQLGEDFNPLNGVTATDAEDGEINKIDVVRNEVNSNVAGKYEVTYSATDSKGASSTKTITVIVNDPPRINAEDKIIRLGEEFNPLIGVSAIDKEDGTISNIEVIDNNVEINEEGTYTVTYKVEDKLGGVAIKTITVTVKEYIILAESININNKIDNLYIGSSKVLTATVDEKAELKDIEWSTSDENIASIEVIGNDVKITAKAKGQVTITAKTKDGSNKSDSVTIDILEYKENVEDFISSAIEEAVDNGIIIPVLGEGTKESPLEMEVQDVTIEKFEEFLNSFKEINPVIIDKYVEGEFTVYKIKIENKSIISKFIRLFKSSTTEEGYIYLKIANNLEASKDIVNKIDSTIKVEKPDEDPGITNPGGSAGEGSETTNPGESTEGGSGTTNPGESTEGGSGTTNPEGSTEGGSETTNPGGSAENESVTITPDKEDSEEGNIDSSKQENSKLPITGQESILGVLGLLAISIGGIIYKKKK